MLLSEKGVVMTFLNFVTCTLSIGALLCYSEHRALASQHYGLWSIFGLCVVDRVVFELIVD